MTHVTMNKLKGFSNDELTKVLDSGDVLTIKSFLAEWGLTVKDNKVVPDDLHIRAWDDLLQYYDKSQAVTKILLNSSYGALLNAGSRFFDQRIGQSTTLSGRTITRHMVSKTNEMITGKYDHYGEAAIYSDTDSAYFSAYPILKKEIDAGEIVWDKESIIEMYNGIAKAVSATFPQFLEDKLHVPQSRSKGVIASSREIVAESGLWIVKKRYACLMIDKDGFRLDVDGKPGKVKAMGLDLKRADTPKFIQTFLSDILLDTLTGKGEDAVVEKIRTFKESFEEMKPWQQGTPKSVNKLSHYRDKVEDAMNKKMKGMEVGPLHVPGHVTASLAWNRLKEMHSDQHTMKIVDGQKIIVCKLKETSENTLTSIAYPVDETRLPEWFMSLPFDSDMMMAGVVDKKISNLLGVLKWDLKRADKSHSHMATLFDFSAI